MTGIASMTATAHVRKRSTLPREANDFYRTPAASTEALLRRERFPGQIWEPACGDGAISTVLGNAGFHVTSTDLIDRGYGIPGRDFLAETSLLAPAVITNPPFKLMDEFVHHALDLGAEKVAVFARLGWLEGQRRHAALWSKRPPSRVWVHSKRMTLWRGDDPEAQSTGGAIAFCWVVWERGHPGPLLGWV